MSTKAARLEMRDISKAFVGVQALAGVSLQVDAGGILALVGENGAGKSTLIKILSGAIAPDAGEILVDGEVVSIRTPVDADVLGIATVYQELNLFPGLSVAENLMFGRMPRRRGLIDWRGARREAAEFLGSMGVELAPNRRVGELSVAERQMLEIAKALHRQVRILVLDEPTAVLGGQDVDRLLEMVVSLRQRQVATIFISHRLGEIFGLADDYVVLKDGRQVGDGALADTNPDALVAMMVGRELERSSRVATQRDQSREALRVEGLRRGGFDAEVSFHVHRGEVLGIAGLRGAGRTELARAIFGADRIDGGEVFVDGERVDIGSPAKAIAAGIGLVPEDRGSQGLLRNLSTAQNIPLVTLAARGRRVSPRAERTLAERHRLSLDIRVADVDAPVGTLSGGNQQKVVLAKWLEAGVSVLILDEPTRGIDVGSKRELYALVRALAADGVAVVFISSELPEILEMSDRILVMRKGRVAAELDGEGATEESVMTYAVGGGSDVLHAGDPPHFEGALAAQEGDR